MNKSIDTLSEDIYHVLDSTKEHTHNAEVAAQYAMRIGGEFAKATVKRDEPRQKGKLWASDLGKRCLRQHWYNFNDPDKAEKLDGHTKFKFLYGNVLEEAVLYFAEEAGHVVTDLQARVEWEPSPNWLVSGRIDAVVDGVLIDVKSTSSYGFKRYKDGINPSNDSFGYLHQLAFYKHFSLGELGNGKCGFVWIDKQNGHIQYTEVVPPTKQEVIQKATNIIEAVDKYEFDVAKGYLPKPYGKSGNDVLDVGCSYCPYKKHCWRDANGGKGLRAFHYSQGPVFFTNIAREPNKTVPELKI
jgi:hypothetical protein